jgi:membrane protein YdbS with pleckstrin-like domain
MGSLDQQLAPGEEVIFRTRLHPVIFAGTAFFAACVIGAVTLIIVRNELSAETVRTLWLAGALVVAASFAPPLARWWTSEFAVTDRRLLARTRVLRTHTVVLPVTRPDAIQVTQTFWGRKLGYGTLTLVDRGTPVAEYQRVASVSRLRQAAARQTPTSGIARAR